MVHDNSKNDGDELNASEWNAAANDLNNLAALDLPTVFGPVDARSQQNQVDIAALDVRQDAIDGGSLNSGRTIQDLNSRVDLVTNGKKYREIIGVIRNSGAGWQVLDDAFHDPVNIASASEPGDGTIRINYGFTGSTTWGLVVTPDETLAKEGLFCGASVSANFSIIHLGKSLELAFNNTTITTHPYFAGKVTAVADTEKLRLTHPTVDGNAARVATPRHNTGVVPTAPPYEVENVGPTTTDIHALVPHGALMVYNSGTGVFDVTTEVIQKPTASFNPTDGVLTVSHQTLDHPYSLTVSKKEPEAFTPVIDSISGNQFLLRFYDDSGQRVKSLDDRINFTFNHATPVRGNWNTAYRGYLNLGMATVDAANVVEAFGNLWIRGAMEAE